MLLEARGQVAEAVIELARTQPPRQLGGRDPGIVEFLAEQFVATGVGDLVPA